MNYMRILSKTSLISSSSVKSFLPGEQIKSQSEVETLRQTIEALKHTIESRDAAIGTLAREKEKLYVELKTAQRTIRNLHQQLEDERNIHDKEKDFLIEEIKRLSKKSERHNTESKNDGELEFNRLNEELRTKDEIIYNICAKYIKMKASKTFLFQEFIKLQSQNQKACEDVIGLLQDNKNSVDQLLSKLIECSYTPPSSKHFLKMLRTNANLHFENTQLKVRLTSRVPKQLIIDNCFDEKKYQQDRFMKMLINKHERRMKEQASRNSVPLNTAEHSISINFSKSSIPYTRTIYKSLSDSRLANVRK